MTQQFSISSTSSAHGSTGAVPIAADNALHPVATIGVHGVGKVILIGTVGGAGPLTNLTISLSAVAPSNSDTTIGAFVVELSGTGGDFATPAGILERSSSSPHTTASGGSFRLALDLEGAAYSMMVSAATANGATLTIDATGSVNI